MDEASPLDRACTRPSWQQSRSRCSCGSDVSPLRVHANDDLKSIIGKLSEEWPVPQGCAFAARWFVARKIFIGPTRWTTTKLTMANPDSTITYSRPTLDSQSDMMRRHGATLRDDGSVAPFG